MKTINQNISALDRIIYLNIDTMGALNREITERNTLSQLRKLVELLILKIYSRGIEIPITKETIKKANYYVYSRGNFDFIKKLQKYLLLADSNRLADELGTVQTIGKCLPYLLRTRKYFFDHYEMQILINLEKLNFGADESLNEYYTLVADKVNALIDSNESFARNRFYILKSKPFYINNELFYEVTLVNAKDNYSKFDRVIAFTRINLPSFYAVKLSIKSDFITLMNKNIPIHIIDNWKVSIRPCELSNFSKILGLTFSFETKNPDYGAIMDFLTNQQMNLIDVISLSEKDYQFLKKDFSSRFENNRIFEMLDICRILNISKAPGHNVLRYLLHSLNNRIIKQQYSPSECKHLSNLHLKNGCKPFDDMPYVSSLVGHNIRISDLYDCISPSNREHEQLARYILNNIEVSGSLFTPIEKITRFGKPEKLIKQYNDQLFTFHSKRRLTLFNNYAFINGYAEDCFEIITRINELTKKGIPNHTKSVNSWLRSLSHKVDSEEKRAALKVMFSNSQVALIYGSAGTGKSFLVNHIANLYQSQNKLFLTNTNPALDNLKRKVLAKGCSYKTIASYLYKPDEKHECDILVIDECSTVSNADMRSVLEKTDFKLLVLVGDVYQIESIVFGNWFDIVRQFIPKNVIYELEEPYRTKDKDLLNFWKKVRNVDVSIKDYIDSSKYSRKPDSSIFEISDDDQIVLCLNYDGLYGINNVNTMIQSNNSNPPVKWGINTYKVNDPILFNETNRFYPLIHNNMKGKITNVESGDEKIIFDLEVDKEISFFDASNYDFELIKSEPHKKSIIRFKVDRTNEEDGDENLKSTLVPFQIAYAISIHKAQGIEFDSVKIIITDEIEELITHNIFYTAITRAKENLIIYWSDYAKSNILRNMKVKNNQKDVNILKAMYKI